MNDQLTKNYLKKAIGQFSFNKRLTLWDSYKCHTGEETRKELDCFKLHSAVISGGCIKFIQAADVVWNSIFKSLLGQYYESWLSKPSTHTFTKGGAILNLHRVLSFVSG